MNKFFLACSLCCLGLFGKAQVNVTLQIPPAGLVLRSQLWNMIVANPGASPKWIHLELSLNDAITNLPVMTATTGTISINPGSQFLQASNFSPVNYSIVDPTYQGFANTEYLPVGNFLVCFSAVEHRGDAIDRVWEDCMPAEIEPIGPPMLIYPFNEASIETPYPVFSWLPPTPINFFTNMTYQLELVEVLPNQSDADAVQENIPVVAVANLLAPVYSYPANQTGLEPGRRYAWRIKVQRASSTVALTDAWSFTYKIFEKRDSNAVSPDPFARLMRENNLGYAVAKGVLKFDYLNETSDTTWNARVYDLMGSAPKLKEFRLDTVQLRSGHNYVALQLQDVSAIQDRHVYLLEVFNSRNERWTLRFEYRKPDQEQE